MKISRKIRFEKMLASLMSVAMIMTMTPTAAFSVDMYGSKIEPENTEIVSDTLLPDIDLTSKEGEPEKVLFIFDKNANDATGKMESQLVLLEDKPYKLSKNTFSYDGYEFVGWSTTKDGKDIKDDPETKDINEFFKASKVFDEQEFVNLGYSYEENVNDKIEVVNTDLTYALKEHKVILYAQWKKTPSKEDAATNEETGSTKETLLPDENNQVNESFADVVVLNEPDISAVTLEGNAAESENLALNAMLKTDTNPIKTKELAAAAFEEPLRKTVSFDSDLPRVLDGNEVVSLSLSWKTSDDFEDDDISLLSLRPGDDEKQSMVMKLNYALAGEHDYEAGDIIITLPRYLFKDRNGNNIGELTVPFPVEPSKRQDFNYRIVGDEIQLVNTKHMSAATKGYIEVEVSGITPHIVKDMEIYPYNVKIEVSTFKGNLIGLVSNEISARIDTEERVTNAYKRASNVRWADASEIPTEKQVDSEEEYVLVDWYFYAQYRGNQEGTLTWADEIPNEYDGFILTEDTETAFDGWRDIEGTTATKTVTTAYPGSQFQPDVTYTFHNSVTYTMTEKDPDNGDDPQLITTAPATAQTSWSWHEPNFTLPEGHFMVVKNGNDDHDRGDVGGKTTHAKTYATNDIDLNRRGYGSSSLYGIYKRALNDLREGNDVRISHTVNSLGYLAPWTRSDGNPKALATWGQNPVKMVTEDVEVTLSNGTPLTIHDDYEIVALDFSSKPWIGKLVGVNLNEDGSFVARHAGDGTFEYRDDTDSSHIPIIHVEILQGDTWTEYATVDYSEGGPAEITRTDNMSVNGTELPLPDGVDNWRTWVETSIAAISYDVRPCIKIKHDGVMAQVVQNGFATSIRPSSYIYDSANMKAYDSDNVEIVDITNRGYDVLYGYTKDTMAVPSKTGRQIGTNYEDSYVTFEFTAKVEDRSYIPDKTTWVDAVLAGDIKPQTSGVWRDLLPYGMTPDVDSVKLRNGDRIKRAYTIENYRDSGRTLLVVECDLSPSPTTYNLENNVLAVEDVPQITFRATYPFEMMRDIGTRLHNVVSFEAGGEVLGTLPGYMGENDTTAAPHNNNKTASVFGSVEWDRYSEEQLLDDVVDGPDPKTLYAGCWVNATALSAARTSLNKEVDVNNEGVWTTGVLWGDETEERTVHEGGTYAYRLRMMSDDSTRSKDLRLYDSLENFHAGDGNDPNDVNAPRWQGEFLRLDLTQLEAQGCAPVVYYSTVEGLALQDAGNPDQAHATNTDLSNTSIWTPAENYSGSLSAVKAIAVDCSKNIDDEDFVLGPLESATVFVHMKAPQGETAAGYIAEDAHAYNNVALLCTSIDMNTGVADSDNFVRKDYTRVGIEENSIPVIKNWDDDNNRDGIRPSSVTVHLLADDQDTNLSKVLDADGDWSSVFEHVPYAHDNGTKIIYSVEEDPVSGYTADIKMQNGSYLITNKHEPEKINIPARKTWVGDEPTDRPAFVKLQLLADGVVAKTVSVQAQEGSDSWEYTFENLPKYRDHGTEIVYTIREVADSSTRLYKTTYNGYEIVNTYHPYGDLTISKACSGTSAAEENMTFDFEFEFFRLTDDGIEPVLDEFDYTTDKGHDGTISSGGTILLLDGETATIHELPDGVGYRIREEAKTGFETTSEGESGYIVANDVKTAEFENRYAAKLELNLGGNKLLTGRTHSKYLFRFELRDNDGELLRVASNGNVTNNTRDDGSVESSSSEFIFGVLRYTQADHGHTFHYTINEINRGLPGYTFDSKIYDVYVTVTDNGDGTMSSTVRYELDDNEVDLPLFANAYTAEGSITLKAWKNLVGRNLVNQEFEFALDEFDADGHSVTDGTHTTARNDAQGEITFETIHYDQNDIGKTFYYVLGEVEGNDSTVIYDDSSKGYTVTVEDNGNGTLSCSTGVITPIITDHECEECGGDGYLGPIELPYYWQTAANLNRPWAGYTSTPYSPIFERLLEIGEVVYEPQPEEGLPFMIYLGGDPEHYGASRADFTGVDETLENLWNQFLAENVDWVEPIETYEITNISGLAHYYFVAGDWRAFYTAGGDVLLAVEPQCQACNGTGRIFEVTDWNTEDVEAPVFRNTLKDGSLQIEKHISADSTDYDQDQTFKFRIEIDDPSGEDVEINSESVSYEQIQPVQTEPGDGVVNTITQISEGVYELEMQGNGRATIPNLPAGASYRVYEQNEDGWTLIEQANTAGTIQPLQTAVASFTNQYAPNVTSVILYGTKILDNRAPEANSFTFELWEGERLVDTQPVQTGGAIMFDPIVYEEAGMHTYTIKEVMGTDSTITYDEHSETVNVLVQSVDNHLTATVEYDADGVKFVNKHNPGNLRLTKNTVGQTAANENDEFTFKVKLRNPNGESINDGIYVRRGDNGSASVNAIGVVELWQHFCKFLDELNPFKVEKAYAETSGWIESGSCEWQITTSGELIIRPVDYPTNTVGTLPDFQQATGSEGYAPWYSSRSKIKSVSFEGTVNANNSISGMFHSCLNLATTNFTGFDTSNVTNMSCMFEGCSKLKTLDLSSLDTSSVTNMSRMFFNCSGTSFNPIVSNWDTSSVEDMSYMFYGCRATSFNPIVSSWDTSSVTDMSYMFNGCYGAIFNPNLSNWDTSSVTNMSHMFTNCQGASFNPDLSNWNTSSVTDMSSMFNYCLNCNPNVSGWDTSSVTDMNHMFYNCQSNSFNPDISSWDTSSVTDMNYMFSGCHGRSFNPNLSSWDTSSVTDMSYMFYQCYAFLFNPNVSGWDTSSVTNMSCMFASCHGDSFNPDVSGWDTSSVTDMSSMFHECYGSSFNPDVSGWDTSSVTNMSSMFNRCYGSRFNPDVSNWDTSSVTNMSSMFYLCRGNYFNPDVSGWDTSAVTDMSSMFSHCYGSLFNPDLSNWDTSSVTNMSRMFEYCSSNSTSFNLDISEWDTSSVTDMSYMFYYCVNCNPNVSGWDTSSVTNMSHMFDTCQGDSFNPDLSNWNTASVTDMSYMFHVCPGASFNPNTSSWDTSSVRDMSYMFYCCEGNSFNPDVSDWDTSSVTNMSYMFVNCYSNSFNPATSGWDTSSVTNMSYMFADCHGNNFNPDVSNWNTSSVTDMSKMFYDCYGNSFSPDISSWNTSSVTNMNQMFLYCSGSSFTSLDLSNWNTSSVTDMSSMFVGDLQLRRVELGANNPFLGATSSVTSQLPYGSSDGMNVNKWIREDGTYGPYAPDELRNNYDGSYMAGTWILEMNANAAMVTFDTQGGILTGNSASTIIQTDITIPSPFTITQTATRYDFFFNGWNTEPDGSGTAYAVGDNFTPVLGKNIYLYAQWERDTRVGYTVEVYRQPINLSDDVADYTRISCTKYKFVDEPGTTIELTAPELPEGFKFNATHPTPPTLTLTDNTQVVKYYFDRMQYSIHYDGNGAEYGNMSDQNFVGGVAQNLFKNEFVKTGYLFTGWSTTQEPSRSTTFTDGQQVINIGQDGETINLYAMWLALPQEESETSGEYEVTLKGGQWIEFLGLPANTIYEITEGDLPSGWSQTGTIGTSGTIAADTTSEATITNTYSASGVASIIAHKSLAGRELKESEFVFELLDSTNQVIDSATNESLDMRETLTDDEGNESSNPHFGMGAVVFDEIPIPAAGTYTYSIREVAGDDEQVSYSDEVLRATVTAVDAGHGNLSCTVSFTNNDDIIENTVKTTSFALSKSATGATSAAADSQFVFDVELTDAEGNPINLDNAPGAFMPVDIPSGITASGNTSTSREALLTTDKDHITFDANGGYFADGNAARNIVAKSRTTETLVSHTSNVDDDGVKTSNYGNSWTNRNIRGTGRTSAINAAHVLSVPGASSLHVSIKFGGESFSCDWVCMWVGAYPNYAATNYSSSLTGRLGGGNSENASNTKEYNIQGDTVTFAYRSDSSGIGDGYGYYAVVTGYINDIAGVYAEPLPPSSGKQFAGWYSDSDCTTPFDWENYAPTGSDITVYAKWADADPVQVTAPIVDGHMQVTLRGGEEITIEGLPVGTTYNVTEQRSGGWTLARAPSNEGSLSDEQSSSQFLNRYSTQGELQLQVLKQVFDYEAEDDHHVVPEEGRFGFELTDSEGSVIYTATNDAEGYVTFPSLFYSASDDGMNYTYYINEVVDNFDQDYTYDEKLVRVDVVVRDRGDGTMSCTAIYNPLLDEHGDVVLDDDGLPIGDTQEEFLNRLNGPLALPYSGDLSRIISLLVAMSIVFVAIGVIRNYRRSEDEDTIQD